MTKVLNAVDVVQALQSELERLRRRVAELEKCSSQKPHPEEKPWEPYEGELCKFSLGDNPRSIAYFSKMRDYGMYVDQQGYIWPKCTPLRDPNIIQLREHDGSAKCPSHAKNKAGRVKFSSSGSLIWFNDLNSAAWARVTHYAVVGDA